MNATVTLAFSLCLAAPTPGNPNLDFSAGALTGWKGQGFSLHAEPAKSPRKVFAVSSADGDTPGRTGRLERTLTVPANAVFLRCRAQTLGKDAASAGKLDVRLLAGEQLVPKQVYQTDTWQPTSAVLSARNGIALEYSWLVIGHAGKTLRLVLVDDDARPGCHLHCSGFRFFTHADVEAQEFSQFMVKLQRQHKLTAMSRYDTAHFTALSNADEEFSKARLQNCEMLHRRFFDHFRARGFTLKEPATKLMVAIFDTDAGFKAYIGPQELRGAQGFYHTQTNRLVIYDYRENRQFQSARQKAEAQGKQLALQVHRDTYLDTLDRQAREFAADQNISLIIHEVAHQLSFNCGLFNRDGDAPFWVVEGFASYCEPTEAGRWLGIGKPNADRLRTLSRANGSLIPLQQLVSGDGWKASSQRETLLYYAQSWALFTLLIDERPQALRDYLKLIHPRRTSDHRLTDFRQVFGAELDGLEKRLHQWVQALVTQNAVPRR